MFAGVVLLPLGIMWIFSAFSLTIGYFIVGKIMDWRGDEGFWTPFPKALLAAMLITIAGWAIQLIPIPGVGWLLKIAAWGFIVMKVFKLNFYEALLLAVILYILTLLFFAFALGSIMSVLA